MTIESATAACRVLLLEDSPDDVFLLRTMLLESSNPFSVDAADSLAAGLEQARRNAYDVVLVDLDLPDSIGLDTLRAVLAGVHGVPIVVLSGHDDEHTARAAVACGADDYLVKGSIDSARMERALRYARERHRFQKQRRSLERQLAHSRKLEAIGQLAAGIAHEINTPAQYVSDNVRFLSDALRDVREALDRLRGHAAEGEPLPPDVLASILEAVDADYLSREVPRALEQSMTGLSRIAGIVGAMRDFSHPSAEAKVATDVNRLLEAAVLMTTNEWKHVAEMEVDLDPRLPRVPCLQGEIHQAFLNLIVNAAHAVADVTEGAGTKGRITVRTRTLSDGSAEVVVADTGCGIVPAHRDRVFDPFFTTKELGRGTGQGLSIVYNVVRQHAGTITFESEVGRGTSFRVVLPGEAAGGPPRP